MSDFSDFLKAGLARTSIESIPWVPKKPGDQVAGKIVGLGQYNTQFGIVPFVELEVPEDIDVIEDGKKVKRTGDNGPINYFRVGFMGKVMERSWETYAPSFSDLLACQHLGQRPQRDKMNDYKLTQSAVMLPDGSPKPPADLFARQEQATQAASNIVAITGEDADRFGLRPGEEEF